MLQMISPDLVPDEIQRFLALVTLGKPPLFLSLQDACSVPDTVLNPGITTRDIVAACKELMVNSGGKQNDFLIDDGSIPHYYSFLLRAWVIPSKRTGEPQRNAEPLLYGQHYCLSIWGRGTG